MPHSTLPLRWYTNNDCHFYCHPQPSQCQLLMPMLFVVHSLYPSSTMPRMSELLETGVCCNWQFARYLYWKSSPVIAAALAFLSALTISAASVSSSLSLIENLIHSLGNVLNCAVSKCSAAKWRLMQMTRKSQTIFDKREREQKLDNHSYFNFSNFNKSKMLLETFHRHWYCWNFWYELKLACARIIWMHIVFDDEKLHSAHSIFADEHLQNAKECI